MGSLRCLASIARCRCTNGRPSIRGVESVRNTLPLRSIGVVLAPGAFALCLDRQIPSLSWQGRLVPDGLLDGVRLPGHSASMGDAAVVRPSAHADGGGLRGDHAMTGTVDTSKPDAGVVDESTESAASSCFAPELPVGRMALVTGCASGIGKES